MKLLNVPASPSHRLAGQVSNPPSHQYNGEHFGVSNDVPSVWMASNTVAQPAAVAPETSWQEYLRYLEAQQRKSSIPEDRLIKENWLERQGRRLKTVFVTTPKTVMKGLSGSSDYSFSDAMLVSKVPYYLGGAFLTLSPLMGGNVGEGIRLGAAMLLYVASHAVTGKGIDTLYKWRYGVDLSKVYRSRGGQVEKVFASNDFPRLDLLKPDEMQQDYATMARKMNIPQDVASQPDAVKDTMRHIIGSSRALKLVIANGLSVVGAGWIARSPEWERLPGTWAALKGVVRREGIKDVGFWRRLGDGLSMLGQTARSVVVERFDISRPGWTRKALVFGGGALLLGTALYIISGGGVPRKKYSTPRQGPLDTYRYSRPNSAFSRVLPMSLDEGGPQWK